MRNEFTTEDKKVGKDEITTRLVYLDEYEGAVSLSVDGYYILTLTAAGHIALHQSVDGDAVGLEVDEQGRVKVIKEKV